MDIEGLLKEYINLCKQYDNLKMKDLLYKILNKNSTLNYNNSTIQLLQNLIPHFTVNGLLNIQDQYYLFKSGGRRRRKNKSKSPRSKQQTKSPQQPRLKSPKPPQQPRLKSPKPPQQPRLKSPKPPQQPRLKSPKPPQQPRLKSPKPPQKPKSQTDNYKDIKKHAKNQLIDLSKQGITLAANNISSTMNEKLSKNNQKIIDEQQSQKIIDEIIKVLEPNLVKPIPNLEELIKEAVINATTID